MQQPSPPPPTFPVPKRSKGNKSHLSIFAILALMCNCQILSTDFSNEIRSLLLPTRHLSNNCKHFLIAIISLFFEENRAIKIILTICVIFLLFKFDNCSCQISCFTCWFCQDKLLIKILLTAVKLSYL